MNLHGRSLLTLEEFSREEIAFLLDLALQVKEERLRGQRPRRLEGYTLAMIFEKRSTRTRSAFESAFGEEGGYPTFLSAQDIHLGVKEDLADTARVLGRMYDCIQFRGFEQNTVEALAKHSGVPVYNGLTDLYHPTQVLADLMTIREQRGSLEGARLAYVGDGRNNVARSLVIGCAKLGVSFSLGAPSELHLDPSFVERYQSVAKNKGAEIVVSSDPMEAVRGADAVYTDVWTSMGEEDQKAARRALLEPYQVNDQLMEATGIARSVFLHCLPAVKGEEVTESVFERHARVVFDQAENRKHTIKAVVLATLGLA
ncbi:MAG: ornithine carbamoyltransferase [Spirochaetales bacterium]